MKTVVVVFLVIVGGYVLLRLFGRSRIKKDPEGYAKFLEEVERLKGGS